MIEQTPGIIAAALINEAARTSARLDRYQNFALVNGRRSLPAVQVAVADAWHAAEQEARLLRYLITQANRAHVETMPECDSCGGSFITVTEGSTGTGDDGVEQWTWALCYECIDAADAVMSDEENRRAA